MTSHFHIPGSFEPHTLSGVHPGVFLPPTSPSGSTYLPATSILPEAPAPKRKRAETRESTPTSARDSGAGRYVLAGQIDTPGGVGAGSEGLGESVFSDVAYRRRLGPGEKEQTAEERDGWKKAAIGAIGGVVGRVWEFCSGAAFKGFYAGGGRGFAMAGQEEREEGTPLQTLPARNGWGSEAETRNFEVPAATPSRTFEADERRRLDLNPARTFEPDDGRVRDSPDSTPSHHTAKRRHINDEVGRNWVMVDDPGRRSRTGTPLGRRNRNSTASASSARRINVPVSRLGSGYPPKSTAKSPAGQARRATAHSRVSHAGSPGLSAREPASFATQRSPVYPEFEQPRASSRAQLSPSRSQFSPSRTPLSPSRIPLSAGRMGHRRAESMTGASGGRKGHARTGSLSDVGLSPVLSPPSSSAPPGAGTGSVGRKSVGSPRLDPEARELAARRAKEERDADVRIAAFNARLKDMIREGREALGTKFEVEVEGDDGDAWMDD
ncbi:uncharacterized protein DNG_01532 [Cephalotrichum gorgonifer]|uniref:Uncharacterized protein n=1 Tax=Cephalotrichum gorgonifer TaxID=2041049 RepID=A0AAE8MT58_9PEZI|nr:uncharacterized protein DNG_01532 [Cephalotrichum gorgonifer]